MKKRLTPWATGWLIALFVLPIQAFSQQNIERAYAHIAARYSLDDVSVGTLKIKDQYTSDHNGVLHLYMVQTHEGVEIFGTSISLALLPNGRVHSAGHHLIPMHKQSFTSSKARIAPEQAIQHAAQSLGIQSRSSTAFVGTLPSGLPLYDKADIAHQDIVMEQGYRRMEDGTYRLVWRAMLESLKDGRLYSSYVDAASGEVIENENMTVSCTFEHGYLQHETHAHDCASMPAEPLTPFAGPGIAKYNALPITIESPIHGALELLNGIEDVNASPYGWHDTNGSDGAEFTYTRGNNVHAFLDRNWDYSSDVNVDGGDTLVFDFPFDDQAEPSANRNVAATNLFVMNNVMHDFTHAYGFNEVAGNFQATNYSGQGAGGDFVNAHAQFGDDNTMQCGTEANGGTECINNADFSTPIDGINGRMRMFTWNQDVGSKYLDVIEPVELAGKINTGLANFGPSLTTTPVTGEVVVIDDGTFEASKGCGTVTQPELAGKIALIDRGLCDFSLKVWNAQEAGAIGAIICNFEDAVITMGAGDMAASVTIPSVFIGSVDCDRIRIAAGDGLLVSLVAPSTSGPVKRDGSLDNGIIAHEYGHGISNRLTFGPSSTNCLNNQEQMGEGWSDFFSLITTVRPGDTGDKKRGVGTFAIKEETNGRGIRSYPYSTDMTVNPHTYNSIQTESVPHGVGSVWCAMLWDMYWAFVDVYGWDPDMFYGTGGNNIAVQLVMDGMKLQPCNPGFIEGRDAILLADTLNNGGENACLIWSVFARRGLGANADGGSSDSRSDGNEGFDLPIACLNDVRFSKSMTPEVLAGGEIEVELRILNYQNESLTNIAVEDPIPDGCEYLAGSANITPTVGSTLVWDIASLDPDEEIVITYRMKTDPLKPSTRLLLDDIEGDAFTRWDIYFDPNLEINNFWTTQNAIVRSGTQGWGVGNVDVESEHYMQNFDPYSISGDVPVYRFYHYYNTETGADGGFMEISTDDGFSWIPLEEEIFRGSYPRKLQYTTFAIPDLYAFSGVSNEQLEMTPVYIDLSNWKGQDVKIRYRFGTDENTAGDGWYVDDVELMDAVMYNSSACMTSDQTDMMCAEAPSRGTIVDTELMVSTNNPTAVTDLMVVPNPANEWIQLVMTSAITENAQVRLFDMTGQMRLSNTWKLNEGVNQKSVSLVNLTAGMYVVQVETVAGITAYKLVKN